MEKIATKSPHSLFFPSLITEKTQGGIRGRLSLIFAKVLVVLLCFAPRGWLCVFGCGDLAASGTCIHPVDDDDPIYAATYSVLETLNKSGVEACLIMGSFIGAARHGEMHPFGEKDVDLGAWTTNVTHLRAILQSKVDAGVIKTTGSRSDFGLQLSVVQQTNQYIDIWLYETVGDKVYPRFCIDLEGNAVGLEDARDPVPPTWRCNSMIASLPLLTTEAWFPFQDRKFGGRSVPTPRTTWPLDGEYGPDWDMFCGGQHGTCPCFLYAPFANFAPGRALLRAGERWFLLAVGALYLLSTKKLPASASVTPAAWRTARVVVASGYVAVATAPSVLYVLASSRRRVFESTASSRVSLLFAHAYFPALCLAARDRGELVRRAAAALAADALTTFTHLGAMEEWVWFWGWGLPVLVDVAARAAAAPGGAEEGGSAARVLRGNRLLRAVAFAYWAYLLCLRFRAEYM